MGIDLEEKKDLDVEEQQPIGGEESPPQEGKTEGQVKIDPAEANIILDAIFTRGVYEEEVSLPKGHKCVFATRSVKLAKEILARLEQDNPVRMSRYNQLYGAYCLAASLKSFDNKTLPESFEDRIKITDLWAGPLVDILIGELIKFDDKVAMAYTVEQVKN